MRIKKCGGLFDRKPISFALLFAGIMHSNVWALDMSVTVDRGVAPQGDLLETKVLVTNDGTSTESDLSVIMVYPAELTSLSESYVSGPFSDDSSCASGGLSTTCSTGETMVWSVGALEPGESSEFSFTPSIANSAADGTVIDFSANLIQGSGTVASDSDQTTVDANAQVELSIDADQQPAQAGANLAYALRYGNYSTESVTDATLSFTLPAGATFNSANLGGSESGGVVTWDLGTLVSGESGRVEISVNVTSPTPDGTQLVASAGFSGTSQITNAQTNQSIQDVTPVASAQPLMMTLNVPERSLAGGPSEVDIIVSNTSNSTVSDVAVQLRQPRNINSLSEGYVSGPFINDSSCDEGGLSTTCSTSELLNWSVGALSPGQSQTITVPYYVGSSTTNGRLIPFEVELTSEASLPIVDGSTVVVDNDVGFDLIVTEDKHPAIAGETIQYTVRYGNTSAESLTDAELRFLLPEGVTFIDATGAYSFTNGEVIWDVGNLVAGEAGRFQVDATVSSLAIGSLLKAEAVINGTSQITFNSTEQTNRTTTVVGERQPLAVSVDMPERVNPGFAQPVKATVGNHSNETVTSAELVIRHPKWISSLSEGYIAGPFDDDGSCFVSGLSTTCSIDEFLRWPIGNLTAGQVETVTLPYYLASNTPEGEVVELVATVTSDGNADVAEASSFIADAEGDLSLEIISSAQPVASDETVQYTVHYGNTSSESVTDAVLAFLLPEGASFVSATHDGVHAGDSVRWDLTTLVAGESGRVDIEVTLPSLAAGSLVEARAALDGASQVTFNQTTQLSDSTLTVTASEPPLALAMNIQESAKAGGAVPLEIVVGNHSTNAQTDVVVQMRNPRYLSSVSEGYFFGPLVEDTSCNEGGLSTTCSPEEFINFSVGALAAGEVETITVPYYILSNTVEGTLIPFIVELSHDGGDVITQSKTVRVDSNADLSLAIDHGQESVLAGSEQTLSVRFGNTSVESITDTNVSIEIPDDTVLLYTSPEATVDGRWVSWDIGTLASGSAGQRQVKFETSDTAANGALINSRAVITGSNQVTFLTTEQRAHSSAYFVERMDAELTLTLNAQPVAAGESVTASLSITNHSGDAITDLELLMRYPRLFSSVSESAIVGPFVIDQSCNLGGLSTTCSEEEELVWNLSSLSPGETVDIVIPSSIGSNVSNGSLTRLLAELTSDGNNISRASVNLPIGVGSDDDADGWAGSFDNCPTDSNSDQADNDLDLLGNVCDDDDDNDLIPDTFEISFGMDPFDPTDAEGDLDGDGISNLDEYLAGSDPTGNGGTVNVQPAAVIADIGGVNGRDVVTLDGTGSSDPEGQQLTFSWVQIAGIEVSLSGADTNQMSFTAPDVAEAGETLRFELTVSDGVLTATDTIDVAVAHTVAPATTTMSLVTLPAVEFVSGAGEEVVLAFSIVSDALGNELHSLVLESAGDLIEAQDVNDVRIYLDANQDAIHDDEDEMLSQGNFEGDNGAVVLELFEAIALPAGSSQFIVTYEF